MSAARNSLQSFELSRLSHASNLRKEIAALEDQWLEENAVAMLARLLLKGASVLRPPLVPFPPTMRGRNESNPCPIMFLRIEPPHRTGRAVRPHIPHAFGGLLLVSALKMPANVRRGFWPTGVPARTCPKGRLTLARTWLARATQQCVPQSQALIIALPSIEAILRPLMSWWRYKSYGP